MGKVSFGNHSAAVAARSDQARIRSFYRDVLGCRVVVESEEVDRYQLDDFHLTFVWKESAAQPAAYLAATWLEIRTDRPEELIAKLRAFGVQKLDIPDPHFYFQAPQGQVYRVVAVEEDLSIYEQSTSARPGLA